ncbi:MAG: hypothetical protein ACJ741_00580 [Pyrinomonadaceae bacterium]
MLEEAKRRAAGNEEPVKYTVDSIVVRYSVDNALLLTSYTVETEGVLGKHWLEKQEEVMLVRKEQDGWKVLTDRYWVARPSPTPTP